MSRAHAGPPLHGVERIKAGISPVVFHSDAESADAAHTAGLCGAHVGQPMIDPRDVDMSPIRRKSVVLVPESVNREKSAAFWSSVEEAVRAAGAGTVRSLKLPPAPDFPFVAGNTSEWLAAGGTADRWKALLRESEVSDPTPTVELLQASGIRPEPIEWFWDGWLAAGKMHVLGGAPGTGKTTLALALAAAISTGGRWPDGTAAARGAVAIWSGEDDPADTLVPRLTLAGADLDRVHLIATVREGADRRSFDPASDVEALRLRLDEIGNIRLLIVDPIVSAIAGDSHKNAEVRRGLQPLADLAAATRCAVLGITHFTKGTGGRDPVERLTGSLAFGAVARVVMVAVRRQAADESGPARLLVRAKSNIGPDTGGFAYELVQRELADFPGVTTSRVLWGEALAGTARDLLAEAEAPNDTGASGALKAAKAFLEDLLASGPMSPKEVRSEASGAGLSWATIRRAKEELGIRAEKCGMRAGWIWRIPGQEATQENPDSPKMLKNTEDAQQKVLGTFATVEHLRAEEVVEI
ncbi:MAG: AAA family ATPase [Nitrospirota bacterium]|nr:AAA family ATPase [Nitrospirota bacterium]